MRIILVNKFITSSVPLSLQVHLCVWGLGKRISERSLLLHILHGFLVAHAEHWHFEIVVDARSAILLFLCLRLHNILLHWFFFSRWKWFSICVKRSVQTRGWCTWSSNRSYCVCYSTSLYRRCLGVSMSYRLKSYFFSIKELNWLLVSDL